MAGLQSLPAAISYQEDGETQWSCLLIRRVRLSRTLVDIYWNATNHVWNDTVHKTTGWWALDMGANSRRPLDCLQYACDLDLRPFNSKSMSSRISQGRPVCQVWTLSNHSIFGVMLLTNRHTQTPINALLPRLIHWKTQHYHRKQTFVFIHADCVGQRGYDVRVSLFVHSITQKRMILKCSNSNLVLTVGMTLGYPRFWALVGCWHAARKEAHLEVPYFL